MKTADRNHRPESSSLTRRAFVAGAGAAALAAGVGKAWAGSHEHDGHGDHADHAGHGDHGKYASLQQAALDCVGKSEACIAHCLVQLKAGNTAMADCASAVQAMNAACTGLASLAALGSKHLPKYAQACIEICESCEEECRKHEKVHEVCRECAESCKACIAECRKVAA